MKTLSKICIFVLVLFSCSETEVKTPPKPNPAPEIKVPVQQKAKESPQKQKYIRLVLDNPERKKITLIDKAGLEKTSDLAYDSILLDKAEKVKFKVDGKLYEELVGDNLCVMINPSLKNYLLEEIVYENGKRKIEGPFNMQTQTFAKKDSEGKHVGPFELIKERMFIRGFTLAPEDPVPDNVRVSKEKIQRFKKLNRY